MVPNESLTAQNEPPSYRGNPANLVNNDGSDSGSSIGPESRDDISTTVPDVGRILISLRDSNSTTSSNLLRQGDGSWLYVPIVSR